eukprot:TRINITY_DN10987_c0_g1_i1.p1 TRINITY_DN10987_c0_g1~~TRINITY_DN10987_c0_g1_i1.p1  ORF type:complete len:289 (+),score=59.09 TRINITY_DN10987_c0_g1_i1:58-924(+)
MDENILNASLPATPTLPSPPKTTKFHHFALESQHTEKTPEISPSLASTYRPQCMASPPCDKSPLFSPPLTTPFLRAKGIEHDKSSPASNQSPVFSPTQTPMLRYQHTEKQRALPPRVLSLDNSLSPSDFFDKGKSHDRSWDSHDFIASQLAQSPLASVQSLPNTPPVGTPPLFVPIGDDLPVTPELEPTFTIQASPQYPVIRQEGLFNIGGFGSEFQNGRLFQALLDVYSAFLGDGVEENLPCLTISCIMKIFPRLHLNDITKAVQALQFHGYIKQHMSNDILFWRKT